MGRRLDAPVAPTNGVGWDAAVLRKQAAAGPSKVNAAQHAQMRESLARTFGHGRAADGLGATATRAQATSQDGRGGTDGRSDIVHR